MKKLIINLNKFSNNKKNIHLLFNLNVVVL